MLALAPVETHTGRETGRSGIAGHAIKPRLRLILIAGQWYIVLMSGMRWALIAARQVAQPRRPCYTCDPLSRGLGGKGGV